MHNCNALLYCNDKKNAIAMVIIYVLFCFFADDMLLFTEANLQQMEYVREVLGYFCHFSGAKVSKEKSNIVFSSNVPRPVGSEISNLVGFRVANSLGTYLGIPFVEGRSERQRFAPLLKKIRARLDNFSGRSLSLAGRLTLVKSVLCSIPYYTMQIARLPCSVCRSIEEMIRSFLWGSSGEA